MKKCTNAKCGYENEDGSVFCERCGKKLNGESKSYIKFYLIGGLIFLSIIGILYFTVFNKTKSNISNVNLILKIAGSNTIGAKLAPGLAKEFMEKILNMTEVEIIIPDTTKKVEKLVVGKLNNIKSGIFITAHGSATAFDSIKTNWADIGMSSRKIKQEEIDKLQSFGDFTSRQSEHIIAMDGIAIIVHTNNNIIDLSKEQVAKIFSGEISNWDQVGGSNSQIHVFARDEHSGTWDSFKELVLKPFNKSLISNAQKFESNKLLSDAVSKDVGGIGFTSYSEIDNTKAIGVYEKGAAALLPSPFTISTEDYALSRRLYLYIPSSSSNNYAKDFIDFVISNDGQKVVKTAGFVSSGDFIPEPATPINGPHEYIALITNASRLPVNIRFITGSNILDNKAFRDLDRIMNYISQPENTNKSIILIGFADNMGNPTANVQLSKTRAESVAAEFYKRGLNAEVHGYGQEVPIADNSKPEGREKNRRVEVWLR